MKNKCLAAGLAFLVALVAAGCTADAEDGPSATSEDKLGLGPAWKAVAIVFENIDADFVDSSGKQRHATTTMSPETIDRAIISAKQFPKTLKQWSDGMASASMDVIVLKDPIRHLSLSPKLKGQPGGYTVAAEDVKPMLDAHAPAGKFDSVFVVWEPNDVPVCCTWGGGPSAGTNGMTYAAVHPLNATETLVHEWLHGAAGFYQSHGLPVPDPHKNAYYGSLAADANGSWSAWYRDLLGGHLLDAGEVVGYTANVWRHGTPRVWKDVANEPVPKPNLDKPVITTAYVNDDGWALWEWMPSHGTSHYTLFVTIKKPDGGNGAHVKRYEAPRIDDRPNMTPSVYFSVPKDEICAAAKQSGVPLAEVHAWVEVAPDHDLTLAVSRDIEGSWDCR